MRYKILITIALIFLISNSSFSFGNEIDTSSKKFDYTAIHYQQGNYDIEPLIPNNQAFTFKLLTYNIKATGQNDEWRDVIVEENADILQLSETSGWETTEAKDFKSALTYINNNLEDAGNKPYEYYNLTYEPGSLTGGAVIISRFPILFSKQIDKYFLDDGTENEFQHPLLHTIVDINGTEVNMIGAVHFTPGENGQLQRELDMESALNYIDAQGPVPFIFNGDFNTHSPEDVGKFEWISSNLETSTIAYLLDKNNPKTSINHTWIDAYRTLNPRKHGPTFQFPPWESRLDYIFVNQFFFDKIIISTTGDTPSADLGSDHHAVDVTINMNPEYDLRPPFRVHGVNGIETSSGIKLAWEKNDANDTDDYNIIKDGNLIGSTNDLEFEDVNITPNLIHEYEITATDINNNTGLTSDILYYSSGIGFLTRPQAPDVIAESLPGKIKLNWTLSNDGGFDILKYIVIRSTEATIEKNIFRVRIETTEMEYIDEIERISNTYFYQVFAVNQIGKGLVSELIEVKALELEDTKKKLINQVIPQFLAIFVALIVVSKKRRIKITKY